MSFNPDPSKKAVEIYFSRRHLKANVPIISFNNTDIKTSECQKHLGLILDSKLFFNYHLDEKIKKANKGIGLINRLRKHVPRQFLLTLYKSYIRPHLDYSMEISYTIILVILLLSLIHISEPTRPY